MKKWRSILLWCLLIACALSAPWIIRRLPFSSFGYPARKYDTWAGTLRIWVYCGWETGAGSPVGWINRCASRFEKRHTGVYIQAQTVDRATLAGFRESENPPDMILFSPGVLDDARGLIAFERATTLRTDIADCGMVDGETRAVPVAMGAYGWAINTSMLSEVPLDWASIDTPPSVKNKTRYLMQVPADEENVCWSAALMHLMAPRAVEEYARSEMKAGEGLDIGLVSEPTPTPVVTGLRYVENHLPTLLPDDFAQCASAIDLFVNGLCAAIPVTQREVRHLSQTSDQGRGPDWKVLPGGDAFSDQILLFAVPERDEPARQALSEAFLSHLLTDASQEALAQTGCLRVTDGARLYTTQNGMAQLENVALGQTTVPNAFQTGWRQDASRQVERMRANRGSQE